MCWIDVSIKKPNIRKNVLYEKLLRNDSTFSILKGPYHNHWSEPSTLFRCLELIRCLNSILYTLYYHFKPSMDVANHKPMFLKINISNETTNGNKNTVIKNMQLRSLISFPARLQRVTREREMSHFSDFFFQIHFSVIFFISFIFL